MADLTGYIGPDVTTGTYVYSTTPISFVASETSSDINPSITTMRDNLVDQGWTNPTLMSGDKDGTLATSSLLAFVWPFHQAGSDASGVPDTFGGAIAGTFNFITFQFYDPLALPPDTDPTVGGSIQGVPLGLSPDATLANFSGAAGGLTPWTFTFPSFTGGDSLGTVTAQHTGPDANVDTGSPSGFWQPSGQYLGGAGPLGGGWNLYSTEAPVTGDQMKLTIYEANFGSINAAFKMEMPNGSGHTVTYPLAHVHYNFGINAYQIVFRGVPGESTDGGDNAFSAGGGNNYLAAALNVPEAMGPADLTVSSVVNPSGSAPVKITTSGPHQLAMQDRVRVKGSAGAAQINGAWWVAKIVSDDTIWVSLDPLVYKFGTGASYTGGGTIFRVSDGGGPTVNISAVQNTPGSPVLIETTVAHGLEPGDIVETDSIGGIPALNAQWSVGEVPTPTTLEIAIQDAGLLIGDGTSYSANSATLTSGLFEAMVVSGGLDSSFYGAATVACQGVFGSFSGEGDPVRTLANYTIAIHPIFDGAAGTDGVTSANKPVIAAPYVALRIATGQETRIAGTFWNSYVKLQTHAYGTMETFNDVPYVAWVKHDVALGLLNATLFFRATED
jgi:hypothetical protein